MSGMTTTPSAEPITAERFLHMPENEGAELVDGRIVEVPGSALASWLAGELFYRVWTAARGSRIWIFPPGTGLQLGAATVRKPGLTVVSRQKLPRLDDLWLTVVPDLVAEVVSPGDEAEDLERKLLDYREAGIPLIWVIYPNTHTAQVLTLDARFDVGPDGVLEGRDILPGFSCSLHDLFAAAEAEA